MITSTSLCACALVMWMRSHHAGEIIGREGRDHTGYVATFQGLFSGGGQLALGKLRVSRLEGLPEEQNFADRVPVKWSWRWRREFMPVPFLDGPAGGWLDRAGFGSRADVTGTDYRRHWRGVGVPYWLVVLLTGAGPLWRLGSHIVRSVRRWERAVAGQCVVCGYDLRAAAHRCPECGYVS